MVEFFYTIPSNVYEKERVFRTFSFFFNKNLFLCGVEK